MQDEHLRLNPEQNFGSRRSWKVFLGVAAFAVLGFALTFVSSGHNVAGLTAVSVTSTTRVGTAPAGSKPTTGRATPNKLAPKNQVEQRMGTVPRAAVETRSEVPWPRIYNDAELKSSNDQPSLAADDVDISGATVYSNWGMAGFFAGALAFILAISTLAPPANATTVPERMLVQASVGQTITKYSNPNFEFPVLENWQKSETGVEPGVAFLDAASDPNDEKHAFMIGSRRTILETTDAGRHWKPVYLGEQDEGINYRFTSISFNKNGEGWLVGKPSILFHTKNMGLNWERVPLSAKLPGNPIVIKALDGKGEAEMATDEGAIYVTSDTARNWKAAVAETVSATLNRTVSSGISGASYYTGTFSSMKRNDAGDYVAVVERGNFYMTWAPGQEYWIPVNRPVARRIQDMGWLPNGGQWMTTRAGDVLFSNPDSLEKFQSVKSFNSRGFGILNVTNQDEKNFWAVGGSGSLFSSEDGGVNWKRDKAASKIPGNFYQVIFTGPHTGYILGSDGVVLRYRD